MADHVITLDANGSPDQPSLKVKGSNRDTVQWQATQNPDNTYPQWFIYFLDPFSDSIIATNARGKSPKMAVCESYPQRVTYCPYWTTTVDPRLLMKRKGRMTSGPGGGIIIDN